MYRDGEIRHPADESATKKEIEDVTQRLDEFESEIIRELRSMEFRLLRRFFDGDRRFDEIEKRFQDLRGNQPR